ncbi:MAG: hypothetical protein Kow00121_56830 [Elainellaceae cyanobacterium]
MSRLSSNLIESQAYQNAVLYAQSMNEAINLYSDAAANRAQEVAGISVTHAYLNQSGAIPLPSTFAIELGDRISEQNQEVMVRLYSDYPFPWREEEGGVRDAFEQEALKYLRQNPHRRFSRIENLNSHTMLRYGEASIMKASCVQCHNTHPDSSKTDWEVGDVAGVWEVSQSLDGLVDETRAELRETSLMLGGISLLGLTGLTLVIGRLRQTAKELEIRVDERTTDLAQANIDLERRNQLIRQVFGRYLSDDVVGNLLDRPEGLKLGGERRKITILTSDLRGFSSLSERLPPEEVIRILNLYLEQMADVINQYQGTIDEFMGDGILVLFGAPTAREDDAMRAIACACAMQLAMGAVNETMKSMRLPQLQMGIGINTGEVVVGNIGSEKRTKYGIVGSPVNLTYRIESYTQGGQVLISEETFREAGSNVRISSQRQVQPKGSKEPITIYEVYGVGGRYNVYLPKDDEEVFLSLPNAIPIQYAVVDDKHVQNKMFRGNLVKLSSRGAEIRLDHHDQAGIPPELTNLKLNLLTLLTSSQTAMLGREDLYAKVLRRSIEEGKLYIRFTSIPQTIQMQLNTLYQSIVRSADK